MIEEIIELLTDLVAIDSVNPDLVPGAVGEAAVAAHIAEWARTAGLEVFVDEVEPGRPNVIVTARGLGGGRSLKIGRAHV